MSYVKQTWVDRQVENPLTFIMQENRDSTVTLVPSPGVVTNEGSSITAEKLNHMEDGIAAANSTDNMALITLTNTTAAAGESALTSTTTVDYPTGFNKDNCIVIGLMGQRSTNTSQWCTPITPSLTSAYVLGVGGLRAQLTQNNIIVSRNKQSVDEPSSTANIRLLLMKLPE